MATRTGTSHFVSASHAVAYYKDYGYRNVNATVMRKINEGEIHIGRPAIKAGERLEINSEGRYVIVVD